MDTKQRTKVATSIDTNLIEQLKDLSKKTRIAQSRLFDEAIEDLLKKHGLKVMKQDE